MPPTPEKLKVIRDLVAGITGFSAERGDQLVIETLPFETTLLLEPPANPNAAAPGKPGTPVTGLPLPAMLNKLDQKTLMIGGGAAGGSARSGRGRPGASPQAAEKGRLRRRRALRPPCPPPARPPSVGAGRARPARKPDRIASSRSGTRCRHKMDAQALSSLKLAPVITKKAEVLAKHLREKITKEPEMSAQILRTWIRDEEEN